MSSEDSVRRPTAPQIEKNKPEWSSLIAGDIASKIASVYGVYCGPASIVWIAAVWNLNKGRPYAYLDRIKDKRLFRNGPRPFAGYLPGFELNLSALLKRETNGDLKLSDEMFFRADRINQHIHNRQMPMIVRVPSMSLKNGLHYITIFKSEESNQVFKFHFQDNGVYRSDMKLVEGLGIFKRNKTGMSIFPWGARQVVII